MKIIYILQIIVSALLVVFILLQRGNMALGSAFGQEGFYIKKRGAEKAIFIATVIAAVLFICFSLAGLLIERQF